MLFCRDLERAVEELSELIESPFDPENISILRQKVTDKTVSTSSFTLRSFVQPLTYLLCNVGLRAEEE